MNKTSRVARIVQWPLFLFLFLLAAALVRPAECAAQEYLQSWISSPVADSTAHVWFRHTYLGQGRPGRAWMAVATTGRFELYINGRNVSRDVRMPVRRAGDVGAVSMLFDVTRFLRPDTNVVCVAYSPLFPRKEHRQLSVVYWGEDGSGCPFVRLSDGDWLCREADSGLLPDGGEWKDATLYPWRWTDKDFDLACWQPAEVAEPSSCSPVTHVPLLRPAERVVHISRPRFFDRDGDTVVYDFGKAFHGIVRVTLRDTRKGEHISIGGLDYICSGEIDEQAFRRFTTTDQRRVVISGDSDFSPDQIQNVEALEFGVTGMPYTFRY